MSDIAVVVARFGEAITGGAEAHARTVAVRLARRHDVTVVTTCAVDHLTWANALDEGECFVDGLRVLRFPVIRPRDLARFAAVHARVLAGTATAEDEERFVIEQGPDAPGILEHLRVAGYDAVVFFTALYMPAVLGLPLVGRRSILVPTLHDEVAARLAPHRRAWPRAGFILYNTEEERLLAERYFDVASVPSGVAGVGVEPPPVPQRDATLERLELLRQPYVLYAGRIDLGKGCGELMRHFAAWASRDARADLVLVGAQAMPLPLLPRIRFLGRVSDDDRWCLMAGALAVAVPSRNESLSLVALEALAVGTPIIVPADSPVLAGHARRSRGGIIYRGFAEFSGALDVLLSRPDLAAAMGGCGRRYVASAYSWDRIDELYETAIARAAATVDRKDS